MPDEDGVIATHYRIDPNRPAPVLQGGLQAFTLSDYRDPAAKLIAVLTRPDLPARPRITLAHTGLPVPHAVLPIEYGPGRDLNGNNGWYIICAQLPGPAVGLRPQGWRESDIIAFVLQPAAAALAGLQERGLTHRAINPDNLFRATHGREPITLGPFWAAPPGSLQPAVYEPPYMARCLPNGRGEGTIADDVYALGVTMLALALGRQPLADLPEHEILHRKLVQGSYATLTRDAPITPQLGDLLRGMLAEDPEHRPSPYLLMKPEQARARRVAARPPRRAQVPLNIGGMDVWSARELAHGLSLRPDHAYRQLKNGEVERWLRRCLGDPPLGMRVEDVIRQADDDIKDESRKQNMLVMRAVAAIDPLAPLVWRGQGVQPDALGTALVGASKEVAMAIEEIVITEAVAAFLTVHERRHMHLALIEEQREFPRWLSTRGPAGGLKRLLYATNPMLPCVSPLLGGWPVVRMSELLLALDRAAMMADQTRPPVDTDIAAFIAARADASVSLEIRQVASFAGKAERLVVVRLFGAVQARLQPGPLPGLAGWLMKCGFAAVDDWHSHATRGAKQEQANQAASDGNITRLAQLVDDAISRQSDKAGAQQAAARIDMLVAEIAAIADDAPRRAELSEQLTYEMMTGVGVIACLGAVLGLALL